MAKSEQLVNVIDDFRAAKLGDRRRTDRLVSVANDIYADPGRSLPEIFKDPSQLEGAYRLLANKKVKPEKIIEPHLEHTAKRASQCDTVLVVHDTTTFAFSIGARRGLGVVDTTNKVGFYFHSAFCIGTDGEPLGVVYMHAWNRTGRVRGRCPQSMLQYDPDSESQRWLESTHESDDAIRRAVEFGNAGPVPRIIHVMDRESDFQALTIDMIEHGRSFVFRAKNNRRLEPGRGKTDKKLFTSVAETEVRFKDWHQVVTRRREHAPNESKRCGGTAKKRERQPPTTKTDRRWAQLEVRAMKAWVFPSNGHHAHVPDEGYPINIVHVQEIFPRDGGKALCWYLITDQSVETAEDIRFVIDCYCERWRIEEFHKALKTGCTFENHQFGCGENFKRMLAIYVAVAVQMLRARWYERERPEADATVVFSEDQIAALRSHLEYTGRKQVLSERPTVCEMFKQVARLGGFIEYGGRQPGWLILSRAWAELERCTHFYLVGRASLRLEQMAKSRKKKKDEASICEDLASREGEVGENSEDSKRQKTIEQLRQKIRRIDRKYSCRQHGPKGTSTGIITVGDVLER